MNDVVERSCLIIILNAIFFYSLESISIGEHPGCLLFQRNPYKVQTKYLDADMLIRVTTSLSAASHKHEQPVACCPNVSKLHSDVHSMFRLISVFWPRVRTTR